MLRACTSFLFNSLDTAEQFDKFLSDNSDKEDNMGDMASKLVEQIGKGTNFYDTNPDLILKRAATYLTDIKRPSYTFTRRTLFKLKALLVREYLYTTNPQFLDKSIRNILVKDHEIVKVLVNSHNECNIKDATNSTDENPLELSTIVEGRFTYMQSIEAHLDLIQIMFQRGDIYFSWRRFEELWKTMVENSKVQEEHVVFFDWLLVCNKDFQHCHQNKVFTKIVSSSSIQHSNPSTKYARYS